MNPVNIILNGERFELERPVTVSKLLEQLNIDPRRVAVEHNLVVLKRAAYDSTLLKEGDEVEVVNFVGGGMRGQVARARGLLLELRERPTRWRRAQTDTKRWVF